MLREEFVYLPDFVFNKQCRLLIKRDFDEVFKAAEKFVAAEFILYVKKNELSHPRLGLAFSKRFVAKATNRNRIKRIFRESFRTHQLPAVDIVATARTKLAGSDNGQLFERLEELWGKLSRYYAK